MDKETLSNYGWIVICVLVLAVMIALATPFGSFIAGAVENTTEGLFGASQKAMNQTGLLNIADQEMEHGATVGEEKSLELDMSKVDATLANNDWATISAVIKAGKTEEAGWKVGDISPEFEINGKMHTAKIIGINQDSENTATFMLNSEIGCHLIDLFHDNCDDNVIHTYPTEGEIVPAINVWLNNDAYNSILPELKAVIKTTSKPNNLYFGEGISPYSTQDKLFLLSIEEIGLKEACEELDFDPIDKLQMKGTCTYQYFKDNVTEKHDELLNNISHDWMWLRPAHAEGKVIYFNISYGAYGTLGFDFDGDGNACVVPAFVIG